MFLYNALTKEQITTGKVLGILDYHQVGEMNPALQESVGGVLDRAVATSNAISVVATGLVSILEDSGDLGKSRVSADPPGTIRTVSTNQTTDLGDHLGLQTERLQVITRHALPPATIRFLGKRLGDKLSTEIVLSHVPHIGVRSGQTNSYCEGMGVPSTTIGTSGYAESGAFGSVHHSFYYPRPIRSGNVVPTESYRQQSAEVGVRQLTTVLAAARIVKSMRGQEAPTDGLVAMIRDWVEWSEVPTLTGVVRSLDRLAALATRQAKTDLFHPLAANGHRSCFCCPRLQS